MCILSVLIVKHFFYWFTLEFYLNKVDNIPMRIDKFLKVSRIIKRRAVAADACDGGRIEINGKVVKPSKDVKVGDRVTVAFGNSTLSFEVLNTNEIQSKQSAETMYKIL